jgi:hypothetical protein
MCQPACRARVGGGRRARLIHSLQRVAYRERPDAQLLGAYKLLNDS